MDLSRTGIWYYPDGLASSQAIEFAQRIEALGYSALWLPEAGGRDPFALAALLLAHTRRLGVATGVANVYARDPMAMKAAQYTLAEASGGRFLLGLGVSHRPLVEDLRGHRYGPPLATMRAYLDRLDAAFYSGPEPAARPPRVLAALGPAMLALARERADGAHPYMVPPEHTALARQILGTDALLCTEQKVVLERDAGRARTIARQAAALSAGLGLPNYRRSLARLGYGPAEFENGLSDRLVDALVAWGDEQALAKRVRAHRDAGATHVCIHPLHPQDRRVPDWRVIEALAPGAAPAEPRA
jgi:probable F420-dependent oxidoreductase